MVPTLSEDEIDDLLYFARTGDKDEFESLKKEICEREKIGVVELLQSTKDEHSGNGVLHMAAANGHHEIILGLCKALSNPTPQNPTMLAILNSQNKAGNTALHWAALNGHLDSVKVLLEEGSDPTITNQRGHDAVYEAELNDKKEVVEWVLKEGGEGLEEGLGGERGEGSADADDVDMGEDEGTSNEGTSKSIAEQLNDLDIQGSKEKS